jgi:hypothetical protein
MLINSTLLNFVDQNVSKIQIFANIKISGMIFAMGNDGGKRVICINATLHIHDIGCCEIKLL